MIDIHIARSVSNAAYTAGIIIVRNTPVCASIELPWRDNRRRLSCIPAGEYQMSLRHESPKFGQCFSIIDVPNRDHILMHQANKASQLLGCISPGMQYGKLDGEFAVLSSRIAMDAIRTCFPDHRVWVTLRITDDWRHHV